MIKKIGIRIIGLLVLFLALNTLYTFTLFKTDLEEKSKEIIAIKNTQSLTDIYYFGESSNVTYKLGDSITSSISEITNLYFPTLKITNINKYATHGGVYKHWLKQIKVGEANPKAVVITLNLRSFDAAWIHSKLETQLQESMVLTLPYPNLLNRFLLSLQAFDNKTEQQREIAMLDDWKTKQLKFPFQFRYKTVTEWDASMARGAYLKPDGSWDSEKIILACHYIKGYAFNLDEHNPRIKDFDEIAKWCYKNRINLYLNLLAENVQYADSLVGKELVFLMKQNRDFLVNRYSNNNCKVIDNLEVVSGKEFIDQTWTTEHYSYIGRMKIASNLAKKLKEQFNNQYKELK